ncbi:MAG: 3-phosphoshikimate 1-carboxyvinyltransferase [Planctomycetota bacterium]
MLLRSSRSALCGEIPIPSSKSHTVRALFFGLLGEGRSVIRNPLDSGDTQAALGTVRQLGATVDAGAEWIVHGLGGEILPARETVDVMNSGTTLYIAMSVAALARGKTEFTGDEQIRRRPAENLMRALRDLGAKAVSLRANGCAPLTIEGPLRGGRTMIECPTSQYLTSLLMTTPLAEHPSEISVPLLHEAPYVEMTLQWLDSLNIRYEREEDFSRFRIPSGQRYPAFDRQMPGDFSSAAFFLCAGAVAGGPILLKGLDLNDAQGDKAVVDYLRAMGVRIEEEAGGLRVLGGELVGADLDLNATPDALPAMAVTACFARGRTRLGNVPQARLKETDRIAVMAQELTRLGARVTELPDGLEIVGSRLKGGRVHGHADHRVVMSLCLAGLRTPEPVVIDTAESVAVTFPSFPEKMAALGGDVALLPED